MLAVAPGTMIAGYRIESLLGRGGMGVVYRARQLDLDRIVALKLIAPELVDDDGVRARFIREARAAAAIDHPNVIPVHAAGEQDGVAYLAMRFVAGQDVRTLVRHSADGLGLDQAAELLAAAAAGLDAIHRAGFVHRDVKPSNLLVDASGHLYVTDFGLAKQVLSRSATSGTGGWVGTLDYVAPEQIRGGHIDARADVYALGGVLHFLLTGRVPFEREGDEAKLWAQLSEPPPAPSQWRSSVPPVFDAVVARAMDKRPEGRYPSAGDLGRAALAAVTGAAPSAPERMVARGAAAPQGAQSEPGIAADASTVTSVTTVSGRRRWPLVGGLVLVAAVAGAVALRPGSGPSAVPPSPTPTSSPVPTATPAVAQARAARTFTNVGRRPTTLAYAAGRLWVGSPESQMLVRLDPHTGRRMRLRTGRGIVSLLARGDTLFAVTTHRVLQIDARRSRIVRRAVVPAAPRRATLAPSGLWILADGPRGPGSQLRRYAPTSLRPGAVVELTRPAVAVAAADGDVWTASRADFTLVRTHPPNGRQKVWAHFPRPMTALRAGGGYVWVTLKGADEIARVKPSAYNSPAMIGAGHVPVETLVIGGRLFVSSRNDQTVLVLEPQSTAPLQPPVTVGLNPFALAGTAHSVWVTGTGEDTVTHITF